MVEKSKTNVDRLLLVNFPIYFSKIDLFLNFDTKSNQSTSVFVFFIIFQIFETMFYVFWTQTCINIIVYYVPRRIMRVITRRVTMLAGDQSQDKVEARSVLRAF